MSWIVEDLWNELDRNPPGTNLTPSYRMFTMINEIAAKIGEKWGLTVQLNFPAGRTRPSTLPVGRENLSLLVETGRKKFQGVTETDVRKHLEKLGPHVTLEQAGHGYEGYRAILDTGRIDCLPGGVHLWCPITPSILEFLDWLFENAFSIRRRS